MQGQQRFMASSMMDSIAIGCDDATDLLLANGTNDAPRPRAPTLPPPEG